MAKIFKPVKGGKHKAQIEFVDATPDVMDQFGNGLCLGHDPILVVKGAILGEVCTVKITSKKKRVWHGEVVKVNQVSPHRVEPTCAHFSVCGGCQTQHVAPEFMFEQKQQAIARMIEAQTQDTPLWSQGIDSTNKAYRRKARLSLDARQSPVKLGFRVEGKQQVFQLNQCPILTLPLQRLMPVIQDCVQRLEHPNRIGHIVLIDCLPSALISVRIVKPLNKHDQFQWEALQSELTCRVVFDQGKGVESENRIDTSIYSLTQGIDIHFTEHDFIQVNEHVNQQMIDQALTWLALTKEDTVLDLFCGLGNFSLPLAQKAKHVIGIEGVPDMVQRAQQNAKLNGIENVQFQHADLFQSSALNDFEAQNITKVLLDPARDGAPEIALQLSGLAISHLVYVSCNPASFVRDSKALKEAGFTLHKVCVMDMFPHTSHTELMALFLR